MLSIPKTGMLRSVNSQNVSIDVLCDWIEGSLLFGESELSSVSIVDVLKEENICNEQEMASRIASDAWAELKRRQACLGNVASFSITGHRISRRRKSWKDTPAHSFCVLLSFAKWYGSWARRFGSDYTEQGEIFEELTKESLQVQLAGWTVHLTGWSRTKPNKLTAVVEEVANHLGEPPGELEKWTSPDANDAGLDILCYRPFPDGRVGIPVYLLQCASGGDWDGKLHIPRLKIWKRIVQFTAKPKKAFATPYAFLDADFKRNCNLVGGMLIDRYRLLSAACYKRNWISRELKNRIIDWATPRVAVLPSSD